MPTALFDRLPHQQLGLALQLLQSEGGKFIVQSIQSGCLIDLQNKRHQKWKKALKTGCWIISVNEETCPVQIRQQLRTASELCIVFERGITVSSYSRFPVEILAQLHTASQFLPFFLYSWTVIENEIVVWTYWKYIENETVGLYENSKISKFLR